MRAWKYAVILGAGGQGDLTKMENIPMSPTAEHSKRSIASGRSATRKSPATKKGGGAELKTPPFEFAKVAVETAIATWQTSGEKINTVNIVATINGVDVPSMAVILPGMECVTGEDGKTTIERRG